ncbi:FAD-binding oxidoreductase [Puteibacter caeruleilacunae]|nr:FAD-binding oxidoreductase [Puteibacter caeruleilacunae]
MDQIEKKLTLLKQELSGDIYFDGLTRLLYSTDASAYKEEPLAVIRPKNKEDLHKIIAFANEYNLPLIPRTAGTSLAGQVVGKGIVVDVSKYMTQILELNVAESWVRVEPGVVLDELNKYLANYGLFFGPETSTSNRCMIGGMVGNNSCGAHSLIYGSTREHTLELKTILSNSEEVTFGAVTKDEFEKKTHEQSLEGAIYHDIKHILIKPETRQKIKEEYPHPDNHRRNTGYALDLLMDCDVFEESDKQFNMCKLLAGSEGTLAFTTEIKLNLVPLPPANKVVQCVHFNSLAEAIEANLIALQFNPGAVELMDKTVMDLTKDNILQRQNRFFVEGDPAALLLIEFARNTREELEQITAGVEAAMKEKNYGYAYPTVYGKDISRIWALRKAGLGVLANIPGDAKPAPVIEDTAVRPVDLPAYINEFNEILDEHGKECVYYAHIGSGELHLRPILNLKDPVDVENFREIARKTALLVKKYKGSLSGEHGDGRLRGEFIPLMVGDEIYDLFKEVKKIFDPDNLFNPNKIVNTPVMNTQLRFTPGKDIPKVDTYFDWSATGGLVQAADKCNGSGDCRKSEIIGGTMCPSYMGTRDEKSTTRARANVLREYLNNSTKKNPFNHKEIYEVLDLCLSCKACKSECPSNVDMTKLKAEFLQHYYNENGVPMRARLVGNSPELNRKNMPISWLYNAMVSFPPTAYLTKKFIGFSTKRSLPKLSSVSLTKWYAKHDNVADSVKKKVYLFADEFTNYNESDLGIKTILLLERLGYQVVIPQHVESGRTFLSKGLVKKAKDVAVKNVNLLKELISEQTPLIGIEPSALLTFRDEYPELVGAELKGDAVELAKYCWLIDEFLDQEVTNGNISVDQFTTEEKHIKFHGHCYQKSLASTAATQRLLSLPENYTAEEIPSGCCGMAGAFGYEKEHYDLSMSIGELVLFPEVRKTPESVLLAASGTSCRHQIKDGTDRNAVHPVEILFEALK